MESTGHILIIKISLDLPFGNSMKHVFEKKKFVFNYLIVDKQNKDLTTSYKCTD
jgi:hypothetical protein